jgi:prepilin-type N-terminal cleavage/methylation domain-containing protein
MLNNLKKKTNERGFTIIEVMIVLAIAGLIILIVLLAVPALQRNGRNTAIKNDASAVAAALNEFKSNNDGVSPTIDATHPSTTGSKVTVSSTTAGTASAEAKVQSGTNATGKTGTGPAAVLVTSGEIWVYGGARCDGTTSTRAISVWYSVETSAAATAANNNKCIDA